jgi:hypothetical protein
LALARARSSVGQAVAELMIETLKEAGRNPTRESLVQAAESIKGFKGMTFAPITMGPDDHKPGESIRLSKVQDGESVYFGDLLKAGNDAKGSCP